MKQWIAVLLCAVLLLAFPGCKNAPAQPKEQPIEDTEITTTKEMMTMLQMTIDNTPVAVNWADNAAVDALRSLCEKAPLTIQMSGYGGFEQVGSIGANLPADDRRTTTSAGDLVLYSGNQLVVFYGSNTWAYTRLGHITDQDASDMAALLGNGDVTITISLK